MKIGIDIRTACGKKTGKGFYTFHIVKELLKLDRANEYILYTNKVTADLAAFGNSNIKVIHKNPLLWHFAVIRDFKFRSGDLFFSPTSFIIPCFLPKNIKSVITVHDLVAFLHPHLHHTKSTILEHLFFRMALKKAGHVLVPSLNTKRDLMKLFRYPEGKIAVTLLGVEKAGIGNQKSVIKKYNLPENFILTVGGLEPRKNIGVLIDAFTLYPQPFALVIVGSKGWKSKELQEKIKSAGSSIMRIENVDAEDLPTIYSLAKVFVFPSLYEGFGLPPLEAMTAGCPVICSNAASLPEVCGDAALMFNPNDPQKLAADIKKLLNDKKMREELIAKGKKRAEELSWRKTAEATLGIFSIFQL